MVVCIIPARGGSKGLPRKNLAQCNGQSLIARAVKTARAGGCHRVIVSTDDEDIAHEAKRVGAEVHWRCSDLAGDEVSSEDVLLAVCRDRRVNGGVLVFTQCTSPLTLPIDVSRAIGTVKANPLCVAVAAVPFHAPVWQERSRWLEPRGVTHDEKVQRQRRQDIPPMWRETGAVYAMYADRLIQAKNRFCGPVIPVYQQPWQGVDIDDEDDLIVANALAIRHDHISDLSKFKAIILDFDGVMTNNMVWTDSDGNESVCCNKVDSVGIAQAKKSGIHIAVLTQELDMSVVYRCAKLDILMMRTDEPKDRVLDELAESLGVELSEIVYVGNDTPDVACLRRVGLSCAPADAHPSAIMAANLVLSRGGGDGCVREVCDMLTKVGKEQ